MVRWIRKIGGTVRTTTIPPPPNPPLAQMTDSLKRMKANQESEDKDEADESAASSDSGQSGEDGNNGRRGKDYRPKRFVAIWPLGRPYVTASANAFTPEFENHFHNFCKRCGHSSHPTETCRIYMDQPYVGTLCSHCRQGLHIVCNSRRRDLMARGMQRMNPMVYHHMPFPPFYQPFPYAQPVQMVSVQGTAETTDDSD